MKNVTITVEDSVLEWARIEAARRGSSVSRMLGDFMAEMQRREDTYERAYLAWRTDERTWQATPTATKSNKKVARTLRGTRAGGQKGSKSGSAA